MHKVREDFSFKTPHSRETEYFENNLSNPDKPNLAFASNDVRYVENEKENLAKV